MFTGLIQQLGKVRGFTRTGAGGARLSVELGPLAAQVSPGDSVAIDGCCLTAAVLRGEMAEFDILPETLARTTLSRLTTGTAVNLETALLSGRPLGGHFVLGHIDTTATIERVQEGGRFAERHLRLDDRTLGAHLVPKGSIALDGISLTIAGCDPAECTFWVAMIPETLARTTMGQKKAGAQVNVETDILGKYVLAALQSRLVPPGGISEERLRELGY